VNYKCGGDAVDILHFFANYQIEHHLWPDLPMLKYREYQPRVRELCRRFGIPYKQEGVLHRAVKMAGVYVGSCTQPVVHSFPGDLIAARDREHISARTHLS
jgi:hypothetical protein